jgi:hypothetical protein
LHTITGFEIDLPNFLFKYSFKAKKMTDPIYNRFTFLRCGVSSAMCTIKEIQEMDYQEIIKQGDKLQQLVSGLMKVLHTDQYIAEVVGSEWGDCGSHPDDSDSESSNGSDTTETIDDKIDEDDKIDDVLSEYVHRFENSGSVQEKLDSFLQEGRIYLQDSVSFPNDISGLEDLESFRELISATKKSD